MTLVARNVIKSFITMPRGKNLTMSYEDTLHEMEAFLSGQLEKPQINSETYADITEITSSSAIMVPEADTTNPDPNATENSSSFGDTYEVTSVASDAEVESEYRADSSFFDSYSTVFPTRKRKLSNHWRSFIRPLMWRCKWTELKIKELESQALKYTRELEANDQTKTLELHQYTSDFCSRSFPFFRHSGTRKAMKRRKRKLVENVADISSFMSNHPLFSYPDNKKIDPDGAATLEDDGKQELNSKKDVFAMGDDWLKDGEVSVVQILRQIEEVQSQVHRLRNHLDMVILKNGVKFSSSENPSLLAPFDAQTSAAQSPTLSVGNGDNMSHGPIYDPHNLSGFKNGDLALPDSVVSGYIDGTQIPDVIESTVGLLSAVDVTTHQPHIVESGENIVDARLMHSKVKQEGNMSRVAVDQLIKRCPELEVKVEVDACLPAKTGLVPDPVAGNIVPPEKSSSKSSLALAVHPTNKRKRRKRKAAPGGWNLKCSGEPDSN